MERFTFADASMPRFTQNQNHYPYSNSAFHSQTFSNNFIGGQNGKPTSYDTPQLYPSTITPFLTSPTRPPNHNNNRPSQFPQTTTTSLPYIPLTSPLSTSSIDFTKETSPINNASINNYIASNTIDVDSLENFQKTFFSIGTNLLMDSLIKSYFKNKTVAAVPQEQQQQELKEPTTTTAATTPQSELQPLDFLTNTFDAPQPTSAQLLEFLSHSPPQAMPAEQLLEFLSNDRFDDYGDTDEFDGEDYVITSKVKREDDKVVGEVGKQRYGLPLVFSFQILIIQAEYSLMNYCLFHII